MNIVITGGAGFIGSNAAAYYLAKGDSVIIFDNLSRSGSKKNLTWLETLQGKLSVLTGDVRNQKDVATLLMPFAEADLILHLAGQTAVTTSVTNPREDFESNALGAFNVLETMRESTTKAKLIYSSTNKVYGGMETVAIVEKDTRYAYQDLPHGVAETQGVDFHSPYGCSKGAADQYVHDYSRIYGLDTVVFRQSCIYGPHQFGVEDQGWMAWFIIAMTLGKSMTIYGNGKQVRDVLYVHDLVRAYDAALTHKEETRGKIYNIGGGMDNTLSVWAEFGPMLQEVFGKPIPVTKGDWRPGDQPVYISDIRKAEKEFGWTPTVSVKEGIEKLYSWIQANKILFQ
jgi:CDP-paratose 2-epimerase